MIFKNLYKNSGREKGTLRYFREKLQRRNVTVDVKHFEDCEQLFVSTGKCFVVEALIQFFNMESKDGQPTQNKPPYHILEFGDNKTLYYNTVLDKFLDEYLIVPTPSAIVQSQNEPNTSVDPEFVRNYSLCLLKYFFILIDFKDAVKEGNGERLATLHKHMLPHFKSTPGFNSYAIEMLINIIQNEVFLSEAEAHQCIWSATVNWQGGIGKNIEIDIFQENRNRDIKKQIKSMGANKTNAAIERASRSTGGERKIIENFDQKVRKGKKSSTHAHSSSALDESKILADLREVKPFAYHGNRRFDSFPNISHDQLESLDQEDFQRWLGRHKRNILLNAPQAQDEDDEE